MEACVTSMPEERDPLCQHDGESRASRRTIPRASSGESMQTAALTRGIPSQALPRIESGWVKSLSASTETLFGALEDLGQSDAPILIVGESGTGKRALAAEIHRLSGRQEENFRTVDCTATDSDAGIGLDRSVQASTVFFRNVAEMSAVQQLRAFQAFFNGSRDENDSLRVRVIASSPRTLDEDMRSGRFREDLYYRISSFCLCVPPLRQRKEDVPLLAQHFALKYSALLGRPFELSPQILQLFSGYSWPGNIRELEHVVRTIVAIGDENIAMTMI